MDPRWNHNIHYHGAVLATVPPGCERALDVGCGIGTFARVLARRVGAVTAIDQSADMVRTARALGAGVTNLKFVHGDFLEAALPESSYGFVSAIASLHHMDFELAVDRMKRLLHPGGLLAIVGLARATTPVDFLLSGVGFLATRVYRLRYPRPTGPLYSVPLADPTMSYRQVRRASLHQLPGARFRRQVLFRYLLTWQRP